MIGSKKSAFPIEKARMMYNKFSEPRDMTFEAFYKEVLSMADPILMSQDLQRMKFAISTQRINKQQIDNALSK